MSLLSDRVVGAGTQILTAPHDGPRILNVAMPDWCGYEIATQQQRWWQRQKPPGEKLRGIKQSVVYPTPCFRPNPFPRWLPVAPNAVE